MRSVDVVLLIEHIGRELEVACAVRHLARVRHGLQVEVLPAQLAGRWARRSLRPRLAVVPYSYLLDDAYTSDFLPHWPGCTVFNMAWEELLYTAYEEVKLPQDRFTKEYVLHHAWGEFHRDRLAKHGVPPDHVHVNGQPAYMLYREPYRRRAATREELAARHGLDPGRRWLLFSENYGWAFYPPARVKQLLRDGVPRATLDELSAFCRDSLRIVLGWFADLAAAHDVEVIARPRPATLESDFAAALHDALPEPPANLHVIKRGPVRDWILASDGVVSSYSTTLVEAAVAGKAAFMVLPLPLPEGLHAGWYEHVAQVTDAAAFEVGCLRPQDLPGSERLGRWANANLLAGGDPIAGLADLLAKLAAPGFEPPPLPPPEVFPDRYAAWRALASRPAGAAKAPSGGLARRLLDGVTGLLAPRGDAFVLQRREVPAELASSVDAQDVFDARDVDRLTQEWAELLGDGSPARPRERDRDAVPTTRS